MTEKDNWASRFYGLTITPEMETAVHEGLIPPAIDDLVEAHLKINYSYFGAIDKTLAGFFVLDDEGDNYTVLDVRGDGRVWWQDHETRELYPLFDSLSVWLAYQEELAKAGEDAAEDEIREAFRTKEVSATPASKPVERPAPSTAALADRYQWLVWLLAQPLQRDGKPIQSDEELAVEAVGHLAAIWPSAEAVEQGFRAELPYLPGDPHLAVYWLLHTSLLAMEPQRDRVLAAIAQVPQRTPLVEAFVTAFGSLPRDGDLPVVPGFRARRSLVIMYGATGGATGEERMAHALKALEIAPTVRPLVKAYMIGKGLDSGVLSDTGVAEAIARMPTTPGTAWVRSVLDQRAGRTASPHADELARTVISSGEGSLWIGAALEQMYPMVSDAIALTAATDFLLEWDPFFRPALAMAQHVHEIGGEPVMPVEELTKRQALAEASAPFLTALDESPEDLPAVVDRIQDPELVRVVARRVLYRTERGFDAAVNAWAIRTVLADEDATDRSELVAKSLAALPDSIDEVSADLAGEVTSARHPLVKVLLRLLEQTAEPDESDFAAVLDVESVNEAALTVLAPITHEPTVFDELMRLTELPAAGATVESLWNTLFSRFEEDTYIVPRLSATQAERAARAMIANQLSHPKISARNAAGHELFYFDHVGAEAYLIEALNGYGDRYAASTPGGGKSFDHGETEDDNLKNIVANLYSAVANMETSLSRTALIDRLFTERREYWRMGDAIGKIFDDGVHREALAALRARRDGRAAGCYAYTLTHFVEHTPATVELLQEIIGWPVPNDEIARRFFKYATMVGIAAAQATKSYELVRAAQALTASIAEPPLGPDASTPGRG